MWDAVVVSDRAEELAELSDLWPEIEGQLGMAMADVARSCMTFLDRCVGEFAAGDGALLGALQAKYRRGEDEHQRDWLQMDQETLEGEVTNELLDLLLYAAMIRARWSA